MSNISVLFDAEWTPAESSGQESTKLVARMCPQDDAFLVLPEYDLHKQFNVMRAVGENTDLPVPRARWLDQDPAILGAPFLVMDRATGRAPVDSPPYVFDGWSLEMDPEQQREVRSESVAVVAAIHKIPYPADLVPSRAPVACMGALRAHVNA